MIDVEVGVTVAAEIRRLKLEPGELLLVKVDFDNPELLGRLSRAFNAALEAHGFPNRALVVPAAWEFEVAAPQAPPG